MKLEICDSPIFVVGAPRSGTSMMQWALKQHPELWGGQESDYFVTLLDKLADVYERGSQRGRLHWLTGQDVSWREFVKHVGYGINALYMSRSDGLRWVEQTPQYTTRMSDLVTLFPDAVFIYMLRDGRSVVHSLCNFVNPVPHEVACRLWHSYVRAGMRFRESPDGHRMHVVKYEAMVADTETEVRRLYDFLDMEHEPRTVGFIRKRSPINSSFDEEQAGDKLSPRWASWTATERQTFDSIAGPLLIELEYEKDSGWTSL